MDESQNTILIGVDGGGTGCRAAVALGDQTVLATATGGPANAATGFNEAVKNVQQAIAAAAQNAGLKESHIRQAKVHLGLAGVMNEDIASQLIDALPYDFIRVTDDRPTAIAGALGQHDGYLVAVGTGTIIAATKSGVVQYVGGWGFYVADQASGAWLGKRLLEETMLSFDGVKPQSNLTRSTLQDFDNDPNNIVAYSIKAQPGDFGKLAPAVVTAAEVDDPVAVSLMKEGASFLEQALMALKFKAGDRVCLTGGVGRFYKPYLSNKVSSNLVEPLGTSVNGAIYLAAQIGRHPQEVSA